MLRDACRVRCEDEKAVEDTERVCRRGGVVD